MIAREVQKQWNCLKDALKNPMLSRSDYLQSLMDMIVQLEALKAVAVKESKYVQGAS